MPVIDAAHELIPEPRFNHQDLFHMYAEVPGIDMDSDAMKRPFDTLVPHQVAIMPVGV
jgi:hypothetical protein